MQARRIVNTSTDNLKRVSFGVMAILFFINLSLMEKANREQTTEANFRSAAIDQGKQFGAPPLTGAEETEFLRMTANRLRATQEEIVAEIDRIELRIRAIELRNNPSE